MEKQNQNNKSQSFHLPENLEQEVRELHLAIKQAAFYPKGHPVRVKSANKACKSIQQVLSAQQDHSLMVIEDKLYIDEHRSDINKQQYVASDSRSRDIVFKFRQNGIRSAIFTRGMELGELEAFLGIIAEKTGHSKPEGYASRLLDAIEDVSHIRIVDIEYENVQVVAGDGGEDWTSMKDILISYMKGKADIKRLANAAYTYLSPLLDDPDLIARMIEEGADYDGITEPDNANVIRGIDSLIVLGEHFSDEERRDFQKRLLKAALLLQRPVKEVLFHNLHLSQVQVNELWGLLGLRQDQHTDDCVAASDATGVLTRLMDGLSMHEIAETISEQAQEYADKGITVPLRRIVDEFLVTDQSYASVLPEERLAEVETAIRNMLTEEEKEEVFNGIVVPSLEEVFIEFLCSRLEGDQIELEDSMNGLPLPEQQIESCLEEIAALFASEDAAVGSAFMTLEMLESETDIGDYSRLLGMLENSLSFLITASQENANVRDQYLTAILGIMDALHEQADTARDAMPELQGRAKIAINHMNTEDIIDQLLSASLRAEQLDWDRLEGYVHRTGEKAIPSLAKNMMDAKNSAMRHRLGEILASMGAPAMRELRAWLLKDGVEAGDIIPIISQIGGDEALDSISTALNHPRPQVRKAAVNALAKIKSSTSIRLALGKVKDEGEEDTIRQMALSVLGRIGNEKIVVEMGEVIWGKNEVLKPEAIKVLGSIGGGKSVSILSRLLHEKRLLLGRRQCEELQLQAVEALSQIGTQSAVNALREMNDKARGSVKAASEKALESLDR